MTEFLQQTANALALGSIYALVALGVAIIFSILRLANFAHGELMTAAGYTMYYMLDRDISWILVAPVAVLVSILAAVALERIAYRSLRGARPSTLLLTSFAVSVVLQSAFLLSFGARPKPIPFPDWVDAGVTIQGDSLSMAGPDNIRRDDVYTTASNGLFARHGSWFSATLGG